MTAHIAEQSIDKHSWLSLGSTSLRSQSSPEPSPEESSAFSASQQASPATVPIILGDDVAGLDRDTLDLALAAIAHSGGWSSPGRTIRTGADGRPEIQDVGALYSWPGDGR